MQRQLRWLGHIIRLPDNRLPRQLLYTVSPRRRRGRLAVLRSGSRVTSELCCKSTTSSYRIWKTLQGTDRQRCLEGFSNFMNAWIDTFMKRCAARHASTSKPKTGLRCPHYRAEGQSVRMSKIKNNGLDQYGAGPFEQQQFGTAGVKGVKRAKKSFAGRCCSSRSLGLV